MTLMNRLFDDWQRQPYVARVLKVPGLGRLSFHELLSGLHQVMYDRRSGHGYAIALMPGRMRPLDAIDFVLLGKEAEAKRRVDEIRQLCQTIIRTARCSAS